MRILVVLFTLLLLTPTAGAIVPPDVTFIPDKLSPGSAFILEAAADSSLPVRIEWIAPEAGVLGLIPKVDDKFYCYFSDTDPDANCGPSPFTASTVGFLPYTLILNATDSAGFKAGSQNAVDVGSITLDTLITIENSTVFMVVLPKGAIANAVSYAVYSVDNISLITNGYVALEQDPQTGNYLGEVELSGGEYFLALTAESDNDFGGELLTVSIPHSGSQICEGGVLVGGDFPLLADSVSSLGTFMEKGVPYTKVDPKITNIGDEDIENITVVIPPDLKDILSIVPLSTSLAVNDTTFYTLTLDNIEQSMTINTLVNLESKGQVVGQIAVFIPVTLVGEDSPICTTSGTLTIQSAVFAGDFALGGETKTFTITNNGDSLVSGLTYTASSELDDSLSVTLPPSIAPSGSGTVTVTLDPTFPGNYQGTIVIDAEEHSAVILVNANFYPDQSSKLTSLRDELDSLKVSLSSEQALLLSTAISDIESSLDAAEGSIDVGDLKAVEISLVDAEARIDTLSLSAAADSSTDVEEGGEIDYTLIIVAVVVLLAAVGVFFFLKRRATKSPEEEFDEEFEEPSDEELKK